MGQSVVPGNSGVLLLGAEFDAGLGTGFATGTRVLFNTIAGAMLPIWSQTGVAGTVAFGNDILPYRRGLTANAERGPLLERAAFVEQGATPSRPTEP